MLGGGKDRGWLRPLTPEGNLDTYGDPDFDNMVGCHTGQFIGLNVPNAEPGYEYVWENRKSAEIMKAKLRGGYRVRIDDPEGIALQKLQDNYVGRNETTPIDSHYNFNDVTLFKYPIERIREIRSEENAKAQAMMRGGAAEFADRATSIERQMSRGQDTRFRRRDHSMRVVDQADQTLDEWQPEDGLIHEG